MARLRIADSPDFLAVVPYLLGFHPERSVVAVFLETRRVKLTIRLDLPPATAARAVITELTRLARYVDATAVMLLAYGDPHQSRALMTEVRDGLRLDLVDVLLVDGGRWWSLCCTEPCCIPRSSSTRRSRVGAHCSGECCPAEGTPYDIGCHPLAAQAVLAGLNASPSRDSIAGLADGPDLGDRAALRRLMQASIDELSELDSATRQYEMRHLVEHSIASQQLPDDALCLRLAVLATDLMARDVAWSLMTREQADRHLALWQRVVSRTVPPLEPAPLCLLAVAAWLAGNGALLNCCNDRTEEVAADYSMLEICRGLNGLPPGTWDEIVGEMRRELRLLSG